MYDRISIFGKIVGTLSIAFSLTMLPPIALSLWYNDAKLLDFIATFLILLGLGSLLLLLHRGKIPNLHRRDG